MTFHHCLILDFNAILDLQLKNFMTTREIEIIKLVAVGKTNSIIANELHISKHTVITHRKNINKKLNASNPVIMLEMARQRQII